MGINHAFRGILTFLKIQKSYWIILFFFFAFLLFAIPLGFSPIEETIVVLNLGLIWVFEMINTAIEKTVDMITKEWSEPAKMIKDLASGAVLVTKIIFVINLILILTNHI